MNMGRVFRFSADISEKTLDVPYLELLPIFDDYQQIVGAFILKDKNTLVGFIAGNGYPLSITVSTSGSLFFTPKQGNTGLIDTAVLSEKPIGVNSVKIRAEES